MHIKCLAWKLADMQRKIALYHNFSNNQNTINISTRMSKAFSLQTALERMKTLENLKFREGCHTYDYRKHRASQVVQW